MGIITKEFIKIFCIRNLDKMKEVIPKDKRKYLSRNYPFTDIPKLGDKKKCIHCGETITVGDYKVYRDAEGQKFICCPNAPACDGTVLDWWDLD